MYNNNQIVRKNLKHILETDGIKLTFIADSLDWNYTNLISFKNGKRDYSIDRLRKLQAYLDKYK